MPDISNFITEVPAGTMNGSNKIFTVSSIPRAVVVDGLWYFENSGYTRSNLTLTMSTSSTPATTSIFVSLQRNSYGFSSSSPLYIQDSGNISFGLSVIIVLVMVAFTAYIYNAFNKKKPWF